MWYTRAQFGPIILIPFLDDNLDLISTTSLSNMAQLQDKKIRNFTKLTERRNIDISKHQENLNKIWDDYENM